MPHCSWALARARLGQPCHPAPPPTHVATGPLSVEVLPTLVPLAVALLGPDQDSDVQRQVGGL